MPTQRGINIKATILIQLVNTSEEYRLELSFFDKMKFNATLWFAIVAAVAFSHTEAAPVNEATAVGSNEANESKNIAAEPVQIQKAAEDVAEAEKPAEVHESVAAAVEALQAQAIPSAANENVASGSLAAIAELAEELKEALLAAESAVQFAEPAVAAVGDQVQPAASVVVPAESAVENEIKSEVHSAVAEVIAEGSLDEVKANKAENVAAAESVDVAEAKVAEAPKIVVESVKNEVDKQISEAEGNKQSNAALPEHYVIHIYQPLPWLPNYWRNLTQQWPMKQVTKVLNARNTKLRQNAKNKRGKNANVVPAQNGKPKPAQNLQGRIRKLIGPAMASRVVKRQEPRGWNRIFEMGVAQLKNMQSHVRTKRA